ncbi:MAG: MerR family transcriptional regulator [Hyphomicrobiales bacterium]|nr:MerR family transcriptional regulator [Hyphomicrobiales bacterium]
MITIRKLAEKFGISRATLLYYDRIGLLHPSTRSPSGYRLYDEDAASRLREIRGYKNAGLTLRDIRNLIDNPRTSDAGIFRNRLTELDNQIAELRIQQRAIMGLMRIFGDTDASVAIDGDTWVQILEASGMSEMDRRHWHEAFERNAPQAHHSFLRWLGIPEDEVLAIRKRSENQLG